MEPDELGEASIQFRPFVPNDSSSPIKESELASVFQDSLSLEKTSRSNHEGQQIRLWDTNSQV